MAAPQPRQTNLSEKRITAVATWNIQGGIQNTHDKEILIADLVKYRVDVCCLQETHCDENYYKHKDGSLITLSAPAGTHPRRRYGQGFFISASWLPYFHGTRVFSNRISAAQFDIATTKHNRYKRMAVINIYAPTSQVIREDQAEGDTFYEELQQVLDHYRTKCYLVFIAGDFNAKIGERLNDAENNMGLYGKGTRNHNGNLLCAFLQQNDLYLTNTHFRHSMRHRSTWTGVITNRIIHNQIDYIAIPNYHIRKYPGLLRNSRSYGGMLFPSDHKLVRTDIDLRAIYRRRRNTAANHGNFEKHTTVKLDTYALATSHELQTEYQSKITQKINTLGGDEAGPQHAYSRITEIIHEAAQDTIPQARPLYDDKFTMDPQIAEWTRERRKLLHRIQTTKQGRRRRQLSKRRNYIGYQVKKRIRDLRVERVQRITQILESNKGNKRCFEAQKILRQNKYEPFMLIEDDHNTMNSHQTIPLLKQWYSQFFNDVNMEAVTPFMTDDPTPLETPITQQEVANACRRLNNNRACGKDNVAGEYLKYGGDDLYKYFTDLFNDIFTMHQPVPATGHSLLIALNKPNKPKTTNNTRPIQLVNTIRKILSNIALHRLSTFVAEYVRIEQSGFRSGRSTADVIWTYRWLTGAVLKYQTTYHIMGIDLSKAFDCINRNALLELLQNNIDTSTFRIIKYLLADTTIQIKMNGMLSDNFSTTIGVPQGDALSPVLFIIYLEMILRYHRNNHPDQIPADDYYVTQYADDTDFISTNFADHFWTNLSLPDDLKTYNMIMNADKTEYTTLNRDTYKTLRTKKLGSLLSDSEDLKYRISQANLAFKKMTRLWLQHAHISLSTKIRLYNACIKPIATYNLSCNGLSERALNSLNSMHRRHLRYLSGHHYPKLITNTNLYRLCKTAPLTIDIYTARWKLFGHILRGAPNTPANRAMRNYFVNPHEYELRHGRKPTSLPSQLHNDLRSIGRRLLTIEDLNELSEFAQDRNAWRDLWKPIVQNHAANIRARDAHNRTARLRRRRYRTREFEAADGQRRRLVLTVHSPQIIRILRRPNNGDEVHHAAAVEEGKAQDEALDEALANLNLDELLDAELVQ